MGFVFSLLSFALGIICFYYFDNRLEGLFIGILIGRIILNLVFTTMVNKMMGIKIHHCKLIYLLMCIAFLFYIEDFIPLATTWLNLFTKFAIISLILIPLYSLIFFSKSTKKIIRKLFVNLELKVLSEKVNK